MNIVRDDGLVQPGDFVGAVITARTGFADRISEQA
jgi:hypothetical protein